MVKQTKSRKSEKAGKGKVTPVQVAFIVDRYLSDNNFSQTRSLFRTEASDFLSKSPVQEAPKSLLSLVAMLDEYICLKEQKVILDQEKCRLEAENFRVQNLLRGMQDAMHAYNNTGGAITTVVPPPLPPMAVKPPLIMSPPVVLANGSLPGHPVHKTPAARMRSKPLKTPTDPTSFSTPVTDQPTSRRRKNSSTDGPDGPVTAKRARSQSSTKQSQTKCTQTLPQQCKTSSSQINALQSTSQTSLFVAASKGSPVQGSSVAKCLFNQQSQSPRTNSSVPKTPPRATSSQTEKSVSPLENATATSTDHVTPQQITSTDCVVITSETIRVSPVKQVSYYSVERSHCITSSPVKTNFKRLTKRDHIKGRLDFDGSDMITNSGALVPCGTSASESDKDGDIFDFDLPNLDSLGVDFSLRELLGDFDLHSEGINYSYQAAMESSPESVSGSPSSSENVLMGTNQVLSEFSSTVTEVLSEKDMNTPGPDSVTSVKSITKCVKVLSPVKRTRSYCLD